ncbi:MAG: DUF4347 domain-containing protein, partial [Gammaproteobacteria bacterium]|nr:DUF4347 domain-containing protein [Gammaproteobacteria bacterium]
MHRRGKHHNFGGRGARPLRAGLEELETRLLFSADLQGLVPIEPDHSPTVLTQQIEAPAVPTSERHTSAAELSQLLFVDRGSAQFGELTDYLHQGEYTNAVILTSEGDPLEQIRSQLAARGSVDQLHIAAEGDGQGIVIGNTHYTADSLLTYADAWSALGPYLSASSEISFHGGSLTELIDNEAFQQTLRELTGAQVSVHDNTELTEVLQTQAMPSELMAADLTVPVAFEENVGQTDAVVDFVARGTGYTVFLSQGDAVLRFAGDGSDDVLRIDLVGADSGSMASGLGATDAKNHYLVGGESSWRTDVSSYDSVVYGEIYDGIDIRYYSQQSQLEYDFIVAAGADPSQIRLNFDGAESVTIGTDGALLLALPGSPEPVRFDAPYSYQVADDGTRIEVLSAYVIHADGTVGFELGAYDTDRELIIDPILDYTTYFGGTGLDQGWDVTTDAAGDVYLTGRTASLDFPGTEVGTGDTKSSTDYDVFVTKLSADGSTALWSTYIGGSGDDTGYAIEVDASGNVYVTGDTTSTDFATTAGALDGTLDGAQDAFVIQLNASGDQLLYSSYFGGAGDSDTGRDIALGAGGELHVTGTTDSSDLPT